MDDISGLLAPVATLIGAAIGYFAGRRQGFDLEAPGEIGGQTFRPTRGHRHEYTTRLSDGLMRCGYDVGPGIICGRVKGD